MEDTKLPTNDNGYEKWNEDLGGMTNAIEGYFLRSMEELPEIELGKMDDNLVINYAKVLDAFEKVGESEYVERTVPGTDKTWKARMSEISDETCNKLANPIVLEYGQNVLGYKVRTKPQFFNTVIGYEWYQAHARAMDFVADRTEDDVTVNLFCGEIEKIRNAAKK